MNVVSPWRRFFCCTTLALSGLPAFLQAGNLIQNPGFESGTDKWNILIPWRSIELAEPLKVSEERENVHDGRKSAQITTRGSVRVGIATKDLIPVRPGDRYRFSAWVKFGKDAKLEGNAPAIYLRASLADAQKKDIAIEDKAWAAKNPNLAPGEGLKLHLHIGPNGKVAKQQAIGQLSVSSLPKKWEKIEGVIEIPEGVAYVVPTLMIDAVTGDAYYDDVTFEKVPKSTALSRELK